MFATGCNVISIVFITCENISNITHVKSTHKTTSLSSSNFPFLFSMKVPTTKALTNNKNMNPPTRPPTREEPDTGPIWKKCYYYCNKNISAGNVMLLKLYIYNHIYIACPKQYNKLELV